MIPPQPQGAPPAVLSSSYPARVQRPGSHKGRQLHPHPLPLLLAAEAPLTLSLSPMGGQGGGARELRGGAAAGWIQKAQAGPSAGLHGPCRAWHRLRVERGRGEPRASRGLCVPSYVAGPTLGQILGSIPGRRRSSSTGLIACCPACSG